MKSTGDFEKNERVLRVSQEIQSEPREGLFSLVRVSLKAVPFVSSIPPEVSLGSNQSFVNFFFIPSFLSLHLDLLLCPFFSFRGF